MAVVAVTDESIERRLISLLVVTDNMMAVRDTGLRPEVFEEPINRRVFEWMTNYFRETKDKTAPTPLVMEAEFPAIPLLAVDDVREDIDWLIGRSGGDTSSTRVRTSS